MTILAVDIDGTIHPSRDYSNLTITRNNIALSILDQWLITLRDADIISAFGYSTSNSLEDARKKIQNGNKIGKCEICSEEIDIQKCLNLLRNKNLIAKFEIKSKRKDLEKELETFETLKKDPVNYVNESLKETIQRVYLNYNNLI